MTLGAGSLHGQSEQRLQFKADSLDKQTISRSLLTARDSLNTYRAQLTQRVEDTRTDQHVRKRLTTALVELNRSKDKLEGVIAEVAASKNNTWNATLRAKASATLRDARHELKRIREDVKGLVVTSS